MFRAYYFRKLSSLTCFDDFNKLMIYQVTMPVRWPVSGTVYFYVYCTTQIFIDFKTLTITKNSAHIKNIPSFVDWKVVWKYSCIKRPTQSHPPEVQPLNGRRRSRKVQGFDINDTQARAHYIWGADSTKSCTSNDLNSARIEFSSQPRFAGNIHLTEDPGTKSWPPLLRIAARIDL